MDDLILEILDQPYQSAKFIQKKQLFTSNQIANYCKNLNLNDKIEFLGGAIINPSMMDRELVPKMAKVLVMCLKKWYNDMSCDSIFIKEGDYNKAVRSLGTYRFHGGGKRFDEAYNFYKRMKKQKKQHYEKYLSAKTVEKWASMVLISKLKAYHCPISTTQKEIDFLKKIWKASLSHKPQVNFISLYNDPKLAFEQLLYDRAQHTSVPCPASFYKKYHDKHKFVMDVAKCGTLVREDIKELEPKYKEGDLMHDPEFGPGVFRLPREWAELLNASSDDEEDESGDEEDEKPKKNILEETKDNVVDKFVKKMPNKKESKSNNF